MEIDVQNPEQLVVSGVQLIHNCYRQYLPALHKPHHQKKTGKREEGKNRRLTIPAKRRISACVSY